MEWAQARGAEGGKAWEFTAAERTLILKGFEAVPALLDQRHAKRFTNRLMSGFHNFVSYPMNAGQVIDTYRQRLANDEFGSHWLNRQRGQVASDEYFSEWAVHIWPPSPTLIAALVIASVSIALIVMAVMRWSGQR